MPKSAGCFVRFLLVVTIATVFCVTIATVVCVPRYAYLRMVGVHERALSAMRDGVLDVIPESYVASLTSEDLRLLLNGVGDINVATLVSYTSFNDESAESQERLQKFKV